MGLGPIYSQPTAPGNWFDNNPLPAGAVPTAPSANTGASAAQPLGNPTYSGGTGIPGMPGYVAPTNGMGNGAPVANSSTTLTGGTINNGSGTFSSTPSNTQGLSTDPNYIASIVASWAAAPGADPSLKSDPTYWINTIIQNGGLGPSNLGYWANKAQTAWQSGGSGSSVNPQNASALLGQFAQPYGVTFSAPTADQAANTPGYQFALQQGEQAVLNSAAATGTLGTSGTLKQQDAYAQGLASTTYQQTYQNALNEYMMNYNIWNTQQQNVWGRLQNLSQNGINAATAATA